MRSFSYLILLLFLFSVFSCDFGDTQPPVIKDTKSDSLKAELEFKKRMAKLREERKARMKENIEKQSKRRKFLNDMKALSEDEKKIAYYLTKAREYERKYFLKEAKKYARKVLELDPDNAEAKRILKRSSAFLYKLNHGKKSNIGKKEFTKGLENLNKALNGNWKREAKKRGRR